MTQSSDPAARNPAALNPARRRAAALAVASLGLVIGLVGCVPLVLGGAMVGGVGVAGDRRPVGIQLEDQAIEHRVDSALSSRFTIEPVNIYSTSYNRKVLLTGQVPDEKTKLEAAAIAARAENVASVVNELQIATVEGAASRAGDSLLAAKVRTALLGEREPPFLALKTCTTADLVYLMGRVTEREGAAAAATVSRVDGVKGVVKVFEYIAQSELDNPQPAPITEGGAGNKAQ